MASFILIPGAGGMANYWNRVVPLLEKAGHEAIPVELPGDSETDGFPQYRDLVLAAIGTRKDAVVVGQSLGGFTAAMVADHAARLIFVNAMIPKPGETGGMWWKNTNQTDARVGAAKIAGYTTEFDIETYFLHDVPADVLADSPPPKKEAAIIFSQACTFEKWPDIPIKVIAGKDDRFFPIGFQERVAKERLGLPVHAIRGGHLVAWSNPEGLVAELMTA